ncbi:hypothetical protein [Clostridium sp. Marseille-P299]|uniref:hypothetical protein n=1 Tax=Clostridium sp. Marseille-P299 TaxID=1805477 RepID=UPI0008349885|nr:hypothetical protein [Clostridium sp. Marseille-P299]
MNTCKACNTVIPEDDEYCDKCLSEKSDHESELNLDNLNELMYLDSQDTSMDEMNELLQEADYTKKGVSGMKNDSFNDNEIDDLRVKDEEQDIMELLNAMNNNSSTSDNIFDDIKMDHPDLMENEDIFAIDNFQDDFEINKSHDVGDVFSDALSAVTSLDDADLEDVQIDDELLKLIPDIDMMQADPESETEKKSTEKVKDSKNDLKKNTKNKSVLKSIFGNVKEERSQEEIDQLKQQAIDAVEAKEKLKEEKIAKKKQEKLDKKKKEQEKAANKKAAKLAAAKKKDEKIKAKKEAKTKKELELQSILDEIDENEGRVNRIGASIVFLLFAIFAVVVVVGTNIYTYTISIRDATKYFDAQKYNDAYYNVYGIHIKDEDIEIYDKIMTVMFVNKQLNSYNHYYQIEQYPEALDSLLKGLKRYDKYIALAEELGIENDLNYVREKIIKELDTVFMVSEKEAMKLINIEDQSKYSLKVYDVVAERMGTTLTKE